MRKALCILLILMGYTLTYSQSNSTIVLEQEILPHPRLLFTHDQEKVVKEQIRTIPLAKELYSKLLKEADILMTTPAQEYQLRDGYIKDILMISREQIYRMITLSLAHRLTKDARYLKKAESELINVCSFPNWNPRHYLDVAEMTTAVAIAYDWLYDDLQDSTKKLVVESIKTKALDIVINEYEKGGLGSYVKRETNWNVVCNTGMVMGAMAIAEDYPEMAGEVIRNAVKYMPNYLQHFAPDGTCFEGPAYWGYTNNYLSLFISTLNINFNQDFGISGIEGIDKTALYYIDSASPAGRIFNFANSGATEPDTNPIYFLFSKHFGQPEVADFYREILEKKVKEKESPRWFFFLALPWFDNSNSLASDHRKLKLNIYKGINDIGVLKAEPTKEHSVYLIAKGGAPDQAHQQLDIGTFVVETDGVRWSDDLGSDSYDLPGFWDGKPNGKRWSYFRNSNFSHNTLSIDGKIQNSAGRGKIVVYEDKIPEPYFTVDMTSAYNEQATSVFRTFTLVSDTTVVVTDKVKLLSSEQVVIWNMITAAKVICKGKEAILYKDGKEFHLKVLHPENAVFSSKKANTFTEIEKPLTGYQLLQLNVSGKQDLEIKIIMGESLK